MKLDYEDIREGAELGEVVHTLTNVWAIMYCAVTWDFARYHYDIEYAKNFGYDKPVIDPQMHGGLLASALAEWLGERAQVFRLYLRYRGACYVGDTVTYSGRVTRKYVDDNKRRCLDLHLVAKNGQGVILVDSSAVVVWKEQAS